jgi:hypothetical protein
MLFKLDKMPKIHYFLANLFTWFLLAGYMILLGAFDPSVILAHSQPVMSVGDGKAGQNLPFGVVGGLCFAAYVRAAKL